MKKETEALLFGAGSILNIWGNQIEISRHNPYRKDAENIRHDFCMVGCDLNEAIKNGRKHW